MGYPKDTKGYYFYNQSEQQAFVTLNVVFLEKEFISIKTSERNVYLEEIEMSNKWMRLTPHQRRLDMKILRRRGIQFTSTIPLGDTPCELTQPSEVETSSVVPQCRYLVGPSFRQRDILISI